MISNLICRIVIALTFWSASVTCAKTSDIKSELGFINIKSQSDILLGQITAIEQDSRGFVWLGTPQGLHRFDGSEYLSYFSTSETTSLSHSSVWALLSDSNGRLFVGTDRGLDIFNPDTRTFSRVPIQHSNYDHVIYDIHEDHLGQIWVGSSQGLFGLNDQSLVLVSRVDLAINTGGVRSVEDGIDGVLWLGTERAGLMRLSASGVFEKVQRTHSGQMILRRNQVRKVALDHQGNLWIATFEEGLVRLDSSLNELVRFDESQDENRRLHSDFVRALLVDRYGFVWIGTRAGLHRWTSDTASIDSYTHSAIDERSLVDDLVYEIFEDRSGLVWIGTYDGISRVSQSTSFFKKISLNGLESDGPVSSFSEGREGIVTVGTHRGLAKWNPQTSVLKDQIVLAEGKPIQGVMSLEHDRQGDLWVGTFSSGVFRIRDGQLVRSYQMDPDDPYSLSSNAITNVYLRPDGHIWVATYGNGINKYMADSDSFRRYPDNQNPAGGFSDLRCHEIAEGSNGNLLIGTDGGGVIELDPSTGDTQLFAAELGGQFYLPSNNIPIVQATASGVWMGSLDRGLHYVDYRLNEPQFFDSSNGMPRDEIYGLVIDDYESIWVAHPRGLTRIRMDQEHLLHFDSTHGLQAEFNVGAELLHSSGLVVFGGNDGINIIDPTRVSRNETKPLVRLTAFEVFNHRRNIEDFKLSGQVTLSYSENTVGFEFAALDYTHPEKNRYKYKLEGFDSDWIDNGTDRDVTYTNLDPGAYVLRVQGSNNDGVWNEEGLSIPIVITPPPWATWWAYTLYTLLAVLLIYLAVIMNIRRQERQAEARFNNRMELYILSLDETSECVLNIGQDGRVLFANHTASAVLETRAAELIGRRFFETVFQNKSERSQIRERLETEGQCVREVEFKTSLGATKILEVSVSRVRHQHDDIAYVSVARDVTERSHALDSLVEERNSLSVELSAVNNELAEVKRDALVEKNELVTHVSNRDRLLRNVHDRINDNLQMLSSLLSIHASKVMPETATALDDNQQRIKAVALIHENLHDAEDVDAVVMSGYIDALVSGLFRKHSPDGINLHFVKDVADISLDIDQAVPCGLILNELVTNALQHGYVGKTHGSGTVSVTFHKTDREYILKVSDDGRGLPDNVSSEAGASMGMETISVLCGQLRGQLALLGGLGTTFEVRFPISVKLDE